MEPTDKTNSEAQAAIARTRPFADALSSLVSTGLSFHTTGTPSECRNDLALISSLLASQAGIMVAAASGGQRKLMDGLAELACTMLRSTAWSVYDKTAERHPEIAADINAAENDHISDEERLKALKFAQDSIKAAVMGARGMG